MIHENVIVKKRGRKPKQTLDGKNIYLVKENNILNKESIQENDLLVENEAINMISNPNISENEIKDEIYNEEFNSNLMEQLYQPKSISENNNQVIKKRGRKPKGGKIIQQVNSIHDNNFNSKPSVILHLKCCLKDLETNVMNTNVKPFYFSNKHDLSFEIIETPLQFDYQNSEKVGEFEDEENLPLAETVKAISDYHSIEEKRANLEKCLGIY